MNENQQLTEISQQLADIAKEQAYLRGAFDRMNEWLTGLEGRMTGIENRMTALEGRFDSMIKWIIGLTLTGWTGVIIAVLLKA